MLCPSIALSTSRACDRARRAPPAQRGEAAQRPTEHLVRVGARVGSRVGVGVGVGVEVRVTIGFGAGIRAGLRVRLERPAQYPRDRGVRRWRPHVAPRVAAQGHRHCRCPRARRPPPRRRARPTVALK
eukprot:scaffold78376_cov62-Phaeocystis_antarctica.AAC.1